jgi:hypothetical protein
MGDMTTTGADVMDVIAFWKLAFTLLMGLALAEALRQFAMDRDEGGPIRGSIWNRLPALLSCLLLVLPFYQGMNRYFFLTYGRMEAMPRPYSAYLTFDCLNFLAEVVLFFIMAHALPAVRWRRVNGAVLALLLVDCAWVGLSTWLHASPIEPWMLVNIGASVVLLALLVGMPAQCPPMTAATMAMLVVLGRTGLDYWLSWSFYFP